MINQTILSEFVNEISSQLNILNNIILLQGFSYFNIYVYILISKIYYF